MGKKTKARTVVLNAFCPALQSDVFLYNDTWKFKILVDHPELEHKLDLIKRTIESCSMLKEVYQKIDNPNKFSFQMLCPDFLPLNQYIRVACEKDDSNMNVISSVYPVDEILSKGVKKYES